MLIFQLTGSGVGMAGTVVFEVRPVLLLGALGGLIVDRAPRRRIMISVDLTRATSAGLPVAVNGSVTVAYLVGFRLATGGVPVQPGVHLAHP